MCDSIVRKYRLVARVDISWQWHLVQFLVCISLLGPSPRHIIALPRESEVCTQAAAQPVLRPPTDAVGRFGVLQHTARRIPE